MTRHPFPNVIEAFADIVGAHNALTDPADILPHIREPRDRFHGMSSLVLKPANAREVSDILKLASDTGTPVIPQGGNTGLVGGQVPSEPGGEIVICLSRLNRIRAIDDRSNTMVAEAGVVLEAARKAAANANRLFALSLASQGSCQIGGNLSSNAGGTQVLAYGNARELCLGLEVVLPTGEILDDLRELKKDNTGYDLKNLFIGAEGTLGIITAAVLKLHAKPKGRSVAWVGLKSPDAALQLFTQVLDSAGAMLTGFELIQRRALDFVLEQMPGAREPLDGQWPWYVLMELSSGHSAADAHANAETVLGGAMEAGIARDVVLSQSLAQERLFWNLREAMSHAQRAQGGSIKHDISVPVAAVPAFIKRGDQLVEAIVPGARVVCFGHMGDGNLHYNVSQPVDADREAFLDQWEEVNAAVHDLVLEMGGSISAEHGIGQLKRRELARTAPPIALDLMRRIKRAFDPAGIMNPGKVI